MKLVDLLRKIKIRETYLKKEGLSQNLPAAWKKFQITGLAYNSSKVLKGKIFVAVKGIKADGHKFINQAMGNIEEDAFCGIQVPKKLIPKSYNVKNLWKYDFF